MNDRIEGHAVVREAATERLFEASLAELLTGDPCAAVRAGTSARGAPHRARPLAAAALLLGATVVAAAWLLARTDDRDEVQDPRPPLPLPREVEDTAGLLQLPVDTVSVRIEEARPGDLEVLRRFPGLRAVSMNPAFANGGHEAWQQAGPEALRPLTELPQLESLGLPFTIRLTPAHLRVLAGCRQLTAARFAGASVRVDRETVAELCRWPALRTLDLVGTPVTPDGLRALQQMPQLRRFEYHDARRLDAEAFAALADVHRLESLALVSFGPSELPPGIAPESDFEPSPDDVRRLQAMPALRELALQGLALERAHVDALPHRLHELTLGSREPIAGATLRALQRLEQLRSLQLGRLHGDDAEVADAVDALRDLVAALPIEAFGVASAPSPALLRTLAGLPSLQDLSFAWRPDLDLGGLEGAPRLGRLVLYYRGDGPLNVDDLPPARFAERWRSLRTCRQLTSVRLWAKDLPEAHRASLREALGEAIELEVR